MMETIMATKSGSTKPSNGGTKPRTQYGSGSSGNIPTKGAKGGGSMKGGKC
jgi:hypothetical protein